MPWGDWQFWVVSLLAMAAAIMMLRPILARVARRGGKPPSTRASLTIEGRQVRGSRRSSMQDD